MAGRFHDRTLTCVDCGTHFTFAAGEQAFYRERGFREPTRCAGCRGRLRAERNADLIAQYEIRGSAVSVSGYGTYGGYAVSERSGAGFARGFASGGGGPRQRFAAICSECGADTEVPFHPRSDRPIYCRPCFNARRGR